jgi:hypothetical protein
MCLETIASNQTFLLLSLLLQKRESLLKGHAGAIHPGLVPFLRAQPQEMQEANKTDRIFRTMSDSVTAMSKVTSANKSVFAGQRGAAARGSVSALANARGYGRGAPLGALGRSSNFESPKPDFTTPAAQPQGQPARGARGGRGGRGRGRPFPNRGSAYSRSAP